MMKQLRLPCLRHIRSARVCERSKAIHVSKVMDRHATLAMTNLSFIPDRAFFVIARSEATRQSTMTSPLVMPGRLFFVIARSEATRQSAMTTRFIRD